MDNDNFPGRIGGSLFMGILFSEFYNVGTNASVPLNGL